MDAGGELMTRRVLILTSEPTDTLGGMEHVLRELESGLRRYGFSVEVLTRRNSAPQWIARPGNKYLANAADLALSWFLGRGVGERRGPDLAAIVSNGPFGWYLPRLPKSVLKVHFYHGTYRRQAERIRPLISFVGALKLKWWDSMVLERQSGRGKLVLCNSDQTRIEVQDYFGYVGKTAWLPLDTEHFAPLDKVESRRRLDLPVGKNIGLFVGSCHVTKGFSTVRSLMETFPKVHWCLALRGAVPQDLVASESLSIYRDAGRATLPSLYNAADFVVCPSIYESFGYVVAEGFSCGTPVVTSPCGASSALLPNTDLEHLLITDPHCCRDFETAIQTILVRPDQYREMVLRLIRPEIEKKMAIENWLLRFRELTNI
jgi:glycosyltransferase involved in cell wall biosynthesis